MIIGICGISGSGKTTFANMIQDRLGIKCTIMSLDNFYRDQSHLSVENRKLVNYDIPKTIEIPLMIEKLKELINGNKVEIPIYDFTKHVRTDKTLEITPKEIIIVEGIFVLSEPEIRELLDLSIYIDVPVELAVIRRMRRDILERGRHVDDICDQLERTVFPSNYDIIIPSKKYADMIIRGNQPFDKIVDIIISITEKIH